MSSLRLAIVPDFPEEGWPSMDLFAEMLGRELSSAPELGLRPERVTRPFRRRFMRIADRPFFRNADRLMNRHMDLVREVRARRSDFDLFYVCDHSYAHLVHELPPERTGVFCHDLDTFRCLFNREAEPRPRWFRALARRILSGLEKAALVFHTTAAVRDEILARGLVAAERLVAAPPGPAPEFVAGFDRRELESAPFVLHAGRVCPRKRIDVLIAAFALLRTLYPKLRLVKTGEAFTRDQRRALVQRGLGEAIVEVPGIGRAALARLYRRAAAVLVPSEREGFGLPVLEALACGAPVVASDIPAMREVGGSAVSYASVGDALAFATEVAGVLRGGGPDRSQRLAQAARFSWSAHAARVATAFQRLAGFEAEHEDPLLEPVRSNRWR